jgi:acetylornithine deacetylase/succinyl-diaminopimelate desuccinylase-like protein
MPETFHHSPLQIVLQFAEQPAVHQAFRWLHLQEPRLRAWHRMIAAIPAPPFGEKARAEWLMERFRELELEDVELDPCGNALGRIRGSQIGAAEPGSLRECVLLSAHLDTVFSADVMGQPIEEGSRLAGPGVSDNGAGIVALLGVAAAMQSAGLRPARDLVFAGNVGEEGEGNLRGMRHLFTQPPLAGVIRSAVVLDGAGTESVVSEALGSRRFVLTVTGPGGHSWTDAGVPNPIVVLARALTAFSQFKLPNSPRSSWNVGQVDGGTAINAIPQRAEARIDTRSTDPGLLDAMEEALQEAVRHSVCEANHAAARGIGHHPIEFQMETIGERPAAGLPEDAAILNTLQAVDRHLGIRGQRRTASTDANIPLSLGVEAISLGAGGSGGGVHTPQEWYDAAGRDLALRRILLLVLALAQAGIPLETRARMRAVR